MSTLHPLAQAVRSAVEAQNWHAALALTLALPDICGRVETPSEPSSKRYVRWWSENMQSEKMISGEDAYALRCAYLHEGQNDIKEQKARKAIEMFHFTMPIGSGFSMHSNMIDNQLQLDVSQFCLNVAAATDAWASARIEAGTGDHPENLLMIGHPLHSELTPGVVKFAPIPPR